MCVTPCTLWTRRPTAARPLRRGVPHALDGFVQAARAIEVDLHQRLAQASQMRVGVHQAGHDRRAGVIVCHGLG